MADSLRRRAGDKMSAIVRDAVQPLLAGQAERVRAEVEALLVAHEHRDVRDIAAMQQRLAAAETAAFVTERLPRARAFHQWAELLEHALSIAPPTGFVAEFGVHLGETIAVLAAKRPPVHGFDSFEGLPEDWRTGFSAGTFAVEQVPEVEGAIMHVGWFDDTLPTFLKEVEGPAALLHLDADLYSSTKTVLELCADRIVAGTVLVFDEYFDYPGWREHEHRALTEWATAHGRSFSYKAYSNWFEQVVVRIGA